ncbi:gliding motility-associated C-terminal domain-containing protein [Fulvivirgaceae bacterium BMA10]|uniref:Gliding motility-associated C-terminal domain-containing protein n=1 Tax=Splendidivirga corallicola TaxID=3051826 RepID=A0ABT8KMV0_9BACT|nr:gliding motility-associated C-terminal domain-containing protein [Fulvivirgaceae bacterium BMA10]
MITIRQQIKNLGSGRLIRFLGLLFLVNLTTFHLSAQNTSAGGRFEVDYIAGCAPLTIQVTPIDGLGSIVRQYDYDRNGSFVNDENFTFTQAGTYTILQVIQNVVPRTDSITVTVYDPVPPTFSVFNCESNSIQVDIDDTTYDQYEIDFGDGSPLVTINQGQIVPTHNYALQGSYPISVRGIYNSAFDNCGTNTTTTNTINILQAARLSLLEVTHISADTGKIQLNYTTNPDVVYQLEQSLNGISNFQFVKFINDPATCIIDNLNTRDNFYCYRINAFDACNGTILSSDTLCSINLEAIANDSFNELNWLTSSINFSNIDIEKDGASLTSIGSPSISNYQDNDVICNIDYCYQLRLNYTHGGVSISATQCVTAFSTITPESISELTASVSGKEITIDWDAPVNFTVDTYFVERSINGGVYERVGSTTSNSFVDSGLRTSNDTHCYFIQYTDQCGNASEPGRISCAILLSLDKNPNIVGQNFLSWTNYEGWTSGVNSYFLEKLDENGNLISSQNVGGSLSYSDNINSTEQIFQYRIRAISNDATPKESFSNTILVISEAAVAVPGAFTPNGDGLNDILEAKGKFINEFSMHIFTRWGELLFQSDNKDVGWDGTFNGKLMPEGTYIYKINVIDFLGNSSSKSGSFVLLRK